MYQVCLSTVILIDLLEAAKTVKSWPGNCILTGLCGSGDLVERAKVTDSSRRLNALSEDKIISPHITMNCCLLALPLVSERWAYLAIKSIVFSTILWSPDRRLTCQKPQETA